MVKKKSTKTWINKHSKDKYVKLSHSEGYRSRAFHKLFEIDNKFKIINLILRNNLYPNLIKRFLKH